MYISQDKCPACESLLVKKSYSIPDHEYNLVYRGEYSQCESCGTLYQNPMPDDSELHKLYPEQYHSFTSKSFIARMKHKSRLNRLMKFLKKDNPVILDYGCGNGSFILEAAKHLPGATFYGYEIGDHKETTVLEDGRVVIIKGSFEDVLQEIPYCDMITMNHVIEHLPDPYGTIRTLCGKLNVGGYIEGQTPAADSLERAIFGERWSGFHSPRHTVIFSRKGLKTLLEREKLSNAGVTAAFNPAGIAVSLASMPHGKQAGTIVRKGFKWLAMLGFATALAPIDILSGRPGIINFIAQKK